MLLKKLWCHNMDINVIDKYIWKVLEKSNIDIEDFKFAGNKSHCYLQTKLEAGRTRQFYEKKLIDVWCQYGDNYVESNVLLIDTEKHTSQFMGYRSNHILIKSYTRKEQDTWLMQVLFPFLKTLHPIKKKMSTFECSTEQVLHCSSWR